jgi:hypothetical protein
MNWFLEYCRLFPFAAFNLAPAHFETAAGAGEAPKTEKSVHVQEIEQERADLRRLEL